MLETDYLVVQAFFSHVLHAHRTATASRKHVYMLTLALHVCCVSSQRTLPADQRCADCTRVCVHWERHGQQQSK
jgi:hypothetical protein